MTDIRHDSPRLLFLRRQDANSHLLTIHEDNEKLDLGWFNSFISDE
jgi:hypothetical protein